MNISEKQKAFWLGFRDGFRGVYHRAVDDIGEFGRSYELGFVLGWAAKTGHKGEGGAGETRREATAPPPGEARNPGRT